jgi:hypothetical protein
MKFTQGLLVVVLNLMSMAAFAQTPIPTKVIGEYDCECKSSYMAAGTDVTGPGVTDTWVHSLLLFEEQEEILSRPIPCKAGPLAGILYVSDRSVHLTAIDEKLVTVARSTYELEKPEYPAKFSVSLATYPMAGNTTHAHGSLKVSCRRKR